MKLLLITQKVDKNDGVLGFFHRWIQEFAKSAEQVTVICLYKGTYDLPENVTVLSLGKEEGVSRLTYLRRFYTYIWRERKNYDNVFVHMNQVYVILGGVLWRMLGKKIGLWYAHGFVSVSLKIAEKIAHDIFTSTKSGFRLKSKKVNIVGQGIDTDFFNLKKGAKNKKFEIISVGRISPVKDYETLINAIEILSDEDVNVTIIGDTGLVGQEGYFIRLKKIVEEKKLKDKIHFVGGIPNSDIVGYLQRSDLFVNTSHTGSLDKAILEAMSVGTPVLTCNEALIGVLGKHEDDLMFPKKNPKVLAEKIIYMRNMEDRSRLGKSLRKIVEENHNITNFVSKISNIIK